jgi:hypothetical protein
METINHPCKYCGNGIFKLKKSNKKNLYECVKCYFSLEIKPSCISGTPKKTEEEEIFNNKIKENNIHSKVENEAGVNVSADATKNIECCICKNNFNQNLTYSVKNEIIYYYCKACYYSLHLSKQRRLSYTN